MPARTLARVGPPTFSHARRRVMRLRGGVVVEICGDLWGSWPARALSASSPVASLPAFAQVRVLAANLVLEPVSGFEPLTVRLQGRFGCCAQLQFSRWGSVPSLSGYRSMSAVSVHFWHADGTVNASKRNNERAHLRLLCRNKSTKITGQRPKHHKIIRPLASRASAAPPIHVGDSTHHHDQVTIPASLSVMIVM